MKLMLFINNLFGIQFAFTVKNNSHNYLNLHRGSNIKTLDALLLKHTIRRGHMGNARV